MEILKKELNYTIFNKTINTLKEIIILGGSILY
jgi:hypothetical protein